MGDSRTMPTTVSAVAPSAEDDATASFDAFVAAHGEFVLGLAHRLLGWYDDADDVAQEVLVRVLRQLPRFRGGSEVRTWLYRITVNECRRHQRRQWLYRLRINRAPPEPLAASADGVDAETAEQVRIAVQMLPLKDREVIVLRYFEQLTSAEIGAILDVKPEAVDMRLFRARRRLRASLGEFLED